MFQGNARKKGEIEHLPGIYSEELKYNKSLEEKDFVKCVKSPLFSVRSLSAIVKRSFSPSHLSPETSLSISTIQQSITQQLAREIDCWLGCYYNTSFLLTRSIYRKDLEQSRERILTPNSALTDKNNPSIFVMAETEDYSAQDYSVEVIEDYTPSYYEPVSFDFQ